MDLGSILGVRELLLVICFLISVYPAYCTIYQIIYYRFFHPLAKFPGPFWASVTRLWFAYQDLKDDELNVWRGLFERYGGPIVRLTPTLLLVNDPSVLPDIYHRYVNKSPYYVMGAFGRVENLFNMRDWREHAERRKVLAGSYNVNNFRKMEPIIDRRVEAWLKQLDTKFAATRNTFDFSMWATYLVFDIISEVAFGKPFGFVDEARDVSGLIHGWHQGLWGYSILSRLHPMTTWLKRTPLQKYMVANPDQNFGIGVLMRFRDNLIKQRVKDIEEGKIRPDEKVDFLQNLLSSPSLDEEQVKAESLLVMIAGADTTATITGAILHHLLAHPACYAKLLSELSTALSSNNLSLPVPTYDQVLVHCPYYIACLKESLRLSPAAPNTLCRSVEPEGLDITLNNITTASTFTTATAQQTKAATSTSDSNTSLPRPKTVHIPGSSGDVEIACNPWITNRDRVVYGEDADNFRPERWLEDEERAKVMQKYLLTWGYGTRVCLGRDLALMELHKAPLAFLLRFEVEAARVAGAGVEGGDGGKNVGVQVGKYVTRGGIAWFEGMEIGVRRREWMKEVDVKG